MCLTVVSAQVLHVRVVVLLETIVSHEAAMITMNVRISSSAIDMVMQSLRRRTTSTTSLDLLWRVASLLSTELS